MYIMEALRQLNNINNYHVLPSDSTWVFKEKLDSLIQGAMREGTLNKREADFLLTKYPVVPTFYIMPKVHKSLTLPPGRPIVSGIGGIMERPCIYLDHFLQPLALQLDSYIRDSTQLMIHLEDLEIPDNTLLVGLDVESLYTSIAHNLGVQAVSYFLEKYHHNDRHNRFLLELLHFILDKNYFTFDRKYYRQISGTAMGARCAPSYANLFLGWWEETVVFQQVGFSQNVATWRRYIDDVIFLWTGSLTDCENFIANLNHNMFNIRLTSTISPCSIDFLDIKLIVKDNRVSSCLYRKPTATNNLLHYSSFHPAHLKNGIPKGNIHGK
ncbi:uncharacterized protein LOC143812038 [Ranitomeya variabilis]|uniref:uncharacterized protein LOC143812038 n=1 Tax=Ranitomeya variabilis TaxID=490064 RepID=UPI0040564311